MNTPLAPQIFDEKLVATRKKKISRDDFLLKEISEILDDKILDVKREFASVLELQHDTNFSQLEKNNFDLIKSSLQIHWTNDVVGFLLNIKNILREDGFFVANFFGGATLIELRNIFLEASPNAISPRISPMIDIKDAGMLLQKAGFSLPVADCDKIEVTYTDIFALMKHLKKIGENNSLIKRQKNLTGKNFMMRVAELYAQKYSDDEGRIKATFEVITIAGWKPHKSQQKPLEPGSATHNLQDFV
jgi:SAM-dependent methyltransferase